MHSRTFVLALAAVALASCATPYQESGLRGGVSAQLITHDTFMVSAHGNGYTSQATVAQYTLRKAAETTLASGFDWFVLLNSANDSRTGAIVLPGSSTSYTSGTVNAFGNTATLNATTDTYSSPAQVIPYLKPGVVATFRMGRGPAPRGAMLASEVSQNLTPQNVRQADLDAWVGLPVAALDTHPIFGKMTLQRYPAPDGSEVRDYVNLASAGACHNRFTVKEGVVQRYEPRAEGQIRCFTDPSTRPQVR